MIMAQLGASMHQHRHQSAETVFQSCIAIDIDDIHGEGKFAAQRVQRGEHLIAQVAVAAAIERKPQRRSIRVRRAHGRLLAVQTLDGDKTLVLAAAHVQGDRGGFVYGI